MNCIKNNKLTLQKHQLNVVNFFNKDTLQTYIVKFVTIMLAT